MKITSLKHLENWESVGYNPLKVLISLNTIYFREKGPRSLSENKLNITVLLKIHI